ncbi:MAG TPA: IS110 family transposase [Steroidobacteraceae bacterium]|nr:IS110 family transposase [Steroidobacteraceae bacterium]
MEYGAIDLHARKSQIRIVTDDGSVVWKGRIDTRRDAFATVFGDRPRMRILLESSTESEWVAQCLEALGHEVVVADPNYAAMYGTRNRRVKTDERDVTALADANRLGVFRPAHRVSAPRRQLRRELRVRSHLVRMRSGVISLVRSLLRQDGIRLPSGSADRCLTRLAQVTLPAALEAVITPLRAQMAELNRQLQAAEERVEARASASPVAQRLMTAPGVGPVVALAFEATLDDPARFGGDARRVSAFVGLVPSEDSSGERQHKGHITKHGPRELRVLMVQASWVIWRGTTKEGAALRTWAHALAARRGRRIAIVALARRLTRILFAMWREDQDFRMRAPRAAIAA